jgi:hypothetical protein
LRIAPGAHQRFSANFMLGQETFDKFRRVQELLSHQIPSGDMAAVFECMCDLSIAVLEKRKFAATNRPRSNVRRSSGKGRHIPAHVKRAVHERDGGQCTYVGPDGHRCTKRTQLEFDHIVEFALGGEATVENIRLLCKAHNQHAAEQTYGAAFMDQKRRAQQQAAAAPAS